jgi:hypothetical protein
MKAKCEHFHSDVSHRIQCHSEFLESVILVVMYISCKLGKWMAPVGQTIWDSEKRPEHKTRVRDIPEPDAACITGMEEAYTVPFHSHGLTITNIVFLDKLRNSLILQCGQH